MKRTIVHLVGAAAAFVALAAPTPIPEGPDSNPPPAFEGKPAVQHPLHRRAIPRHPFMAANGRSNLHVDAFQTDANSGPGPLGHGMRRASTFQQSDCASITFDRRGRLVAICVGLVRPTLKMFDPNTLDTLASMNLPQRSQPSTDPFHDFSGGGYFYLDNRDRGVMLTNDRHLYVVRETRGPGFAIQRNYDLSGAIPNGDKPFSALPDWSGRYWFVTSKGVVGTVLRRSGKVQAMKLPNDEEIQNSFAVDTDGGVYLVSNVALYRFDASSTGAPKVTWRRRYPNSGIHKPGQADAGSGTTPTIMRHGLVAITDNADPMDVLVYRKRRSVGGRRLVCRQPVFTKGASDSDQSLNVIGRSMIVENNYGYTGPQATEQGKTTTPGLERVDLGRHWRGCHRVWHSNEVAPTVVPKISVANGLVYTYTKPPSDDGSDYWYLTALDFRTGRTVLRFRAGEGLGFNNNYAPITIGPDNGAIYLGTLGGLVMMRDKTPPPRPRQRRRRPRLELRVHHDSPCSHGHPRVTVGGRDADRVEVVTFLVGHRRVARDRKPPFTRIVRIHRGRHERTVTIRARARLADGRRRTLHREVLVCSR